MPAIEPVRAVLCHGEGVIGTGSTIRELELECGHAVAQLLHLVAALAGRLCRRLGAH
jgi:hypothetical protein